MAHVVVPGESRPVASRLEEARRRVAEKKWAEAVALVQAVIESSPNDLVSAGKDRTVAARRAAQTILARSGPECLGLYRKRIESQALRLLEAADEASDRRIVEELFCSTQAVAALDRLGDRAFLAGRLDEAEAWWTMVAPLEPTDLADTLTHPDPPAATAARVRAKQLLARLHRGEANWQVLLDAYRKRHPDAAGTLAGKAGKYADILAECAKGLAPRSDNRDWPTFAGDPSRGRVAATPDDLPGHLGRLCRGGATWRFDLARRKPTTEIFGRDEAEGGIEAARRQAFHPVVVGTTALVADAQYITAYDLRTGKASEWYDAAATVGGLEPRLTLPAFADLRYTLTVAEDCVFARMGTQTVRDIRPDPKAGRPAFGARADGGESLLVSLSLKPNADGDRRRWHVRAVDPGRKEYAVFEGAPVVVAGRVYIAATRFVGDKVVTAIHCYPAHPEDTAAPLLWKTDVCETRELLPAGDTPFKRQRTRHHLLTMTGSAVVYSSHSGVVAALDPRTGRRVWALRYPKRDDREPEDEPRLRDLAPAVFADGKLYVAPSDSDRLFCLDPASGETIWQRNGMDVVHLLGVGSGRLIFTTWRNPQLGKVFVGGLRAVDALTGGDERGWSLPDDGGGLAPMGRGLLAGDLVLWPTARKPYGVFAVRQEDGRQPDNPALLHRIPAGNLVFANGCLLVADQRVLTAFVPPSVLPDEDAAEQVKSDARDLAGLVRAKDWRGILARPELARMSLLDARGVPRLAGAVARREGKGGEQPSALPFGSRLNGVMLPLDTVAEIRLLPGETLLRGLESSASLWTCRRGEILCRSLGDGEVRWRRDLRLDGAWAVLHGPLLLVGDARTAFALDAASGAGVWEHRITGVGMYFESRQAYRVVEEPRPMPLSDPLVVGGRLLLLRGRRCIVALDALTGDGLWHVVAPGAAFGMPSPRGTIHSMTRVGADRVVAQVSGHRLLIDVASGEAIAHAPTLLEAWDHPPTDLGAGRVAAMGERNTLDIFDSASGKILWRRRLLPSSLFSGEPPFAVAAGKRLLFLEPLNIGLRLWCLDRETGAAVWPRPVFLADGPASPRGWAVGADVFYRAAGDHLEARSLRDGSSIWRRPLADADRMRLVLGGSTLLAFPGIGGGVRFGFRSPLGSLQWTGGTPRDAEVSVGCYDADGGELVQRINLEAPALVARRTFDPTPSPFPSVWVRRDAGVGPEVRIDTGGLIVGVGNGVKVLRPRAALRK
jgi:outer membrane protein assembly factor BamB